MTDPFNVLKQGWIDAAYHLTPDAIAVFDSLEEGATKLSQLGKIEEFELLTVVARTTKVAEKEASPEKAAQLSKKLHRTVYEYLLSLDTPIVRLENDNETSANNTENKNTDPKLEIIVDKPEFDVVMTPFSAEPIVSETTNPPDSELHQLMDERSETIGTHVDTRKTLTPKSSDEHQDQLLSKAQKEVDLLLVRKKYDRITSILNRLAHAIGGRSVAEWATDIGDLCRLKGKQSAAANFYLSATRADPIFEEPLLRLAHLCVDNRDLNLALEYYERIASLTQLRGDKFQAQRIYRKITVLAPYRDDIHQLLQVSD